MEKGSLSAALWITIAPLKSKAQTNDPPPSGSCYVSFFHSDPESDLGSVVQYSRRGNHIWQVTPTSTEDWDYCVFCGFFAPSGVRIANWTDFGAGGEFGYSPDGVHFYPFDLSQDNPELAGQVNAYRTNPNFWGILKIAPRLDDVPSFCDFCGMPNHDDDPVTGDPWKITVWEFEIDPPFIDARPVDQLREGQAPYTFTATFKPGVDHNGNPMVTQIEFRLTSSKEPGFCINATREEGLWTDTTANDNDLKFVPNQTGLEIRAPEGTTNYNQAIYTVPQPPPSTVTVSVRVACLDYGAHGSITAIAYGVPSLQPQAIAHWKGTLIERAAQIPKDQRNGLDDDMDGKLDEDLINGLDDDGDGRIDEEANGNGIWDGWEFEGPAMDDNDAEPIGDGTPGDGLSRYEEYRGVMVSVMDAGEGVTYDSNELLNNTFWTALNPIRKDMFVAVFGFARIIPLRATVGYFTGTGMPPVHILHRFNLNNDLMQVNFYSSDLCQICNIPHQLQGVYAALIEENSDEPLPPIGPVIYGLTSSHIWSPPINCLIYTRRIQEIADRLSIDRASFLFHVVGHELGHTVICPLAEGHLGEHPPNDGHHDTPPHCLMESPWQGHIETEFCGRMSRVMAS